MRRHSRPRWINKGERSHPYRHFPQCVHFPDCVGCQLIARAYPEQLTIKRRLLTEAMSVHPSLAYLPTPPVIPSPRRLHYRARVKLVVGRGKSQILTGLYMPGTHRVADISSCPVHPDAVNRVLQFLKKNLNTFKILPYDAGSGEGQLRYLDFRYSFWRKEITLTLVTKHAAFPQGRSLARALMTRFPLITGVLQNINEEEGNVIWGKDFRTLAGNEAVIERIGPYKLKYPAGVFSQANPATAQKLYERVCEMAALTGKENVLDLYCGVGPISLYLAASARMVWGIDESRMATAAAKQNAKLNGLGNCHFLAGDVTETIAAAKAGLDRIDVVVVNPPRKGIQPEAFGPLLALAAPTLLYVSCNPVTLARDLVRLSREGYQTKVIEAFDMFPQTTELETAALLKKSAPAQSS